MQKNQLILSSHSLEIQQVSEFHDLKDHAHIWSQPPKNNNKRDWNLITYLNDLHQNRTQKQLRYFFLIYCKNLTNFLYLVLWTCLVFIEN